MRTKTHMPTIWSSLIIILANSINVLYQCHIECPGCSMHTNCVLKLTLRAFYRFFAINFGCLFHTILKILFALHLYCYDRLYSYNKQQTNKTHDNSEWIVSRSFFPSCAILSLNVSSQTSAVIETIYTLNIGFFFYWCHHARFIRESMC